MTYVLKLSADEIGLVHDGLARMLRQTNSCIASVESQVRAQEPVPPEKPDHPEKTAKSVRPRKGNSDQNNIASRPGEM